MKPYQKIIFLSVLCFLTSSFSFSQNQNNDSIVSFKEVDVYPIPLGSKCKLKRKKEKQKKCIQKFIFRFFAKEFNENLPSELGLVARKFKVHLSFIIDEKGKTINISSISEVKEFQKEGFRILKLLPNWKPAFHNNKLVKIKYSFPFKMIIQ